MSDATRPRPVWTLTWGQIHRAWPLVAAMLPVTAAACFLVALAGNFGLHEDYREIAGYAILMLAIATTIGAMLLIHADAERLAVALPLRILRIPAPTWRLVLGLMTFGLLATAVIAAGATVLAKTTNELTLTWWYPPAFAVCIMAALQAWSYALRDSSPRTAVITLLVILAPLLFLLTRDATYAALRQVNPVIAFAVAVPAIYLLGFVALVFNRRGGLGAIVPDAWRRRRAKPFSATELRPFRSKLASQRWLEWRQFGWLLPVFVIVALALYFLAMPLAIALFGGTGISEGWSGDAPPASLAVDWLRHTQFVTTGVTFAAIAASVVVGAIIFVKAGYWNRQTTYHLTLPVSTRKLARARLHMTFTSALIATALLAGVLAASSWAMRAAGERNRLVDYLGQGYRDSSISTLTTVGDRVRDPFNTEIGASPAEIMVFFVGTLFVTMWVALWAVNAGWAFLVYGVIAGLPVAVLWLAETLGVHEGGERIAAAARWTASAVLIATVLLAAAGSLWKRYAGWRVVVFAALFAAAYTYAFMRFEAAYIEQPGANLIGGQRFPHPVDWAVWSGLAALPIAPFFIHPWLLGRTRNH